MTLPPNFWFYMLQVHIQLCFFFRCSESYFYLPINSVLVFITYLLSSSKKRWSTCFLSIYRPEMENVDGFSLVCFLLLLNAIIYPYLCISIDYPTLYLSTISFRFLKMFSPYFQTSC